MVCARAAIGLGRINQICAVRFEAEVLILLYTCRYSFAIYAWELLTGKLPFDELSAVEVGCELHSAGLYRAPSQQLGVREWEWEGGGGVGGRG